MGNYLVHYGILGMKWGRRKSRANKSFQSSSKRLTATSSSKKKAKKKVKIKELSDTELQKKINRLQMEKRYRDLKKDEISAGRKLVGDILMTSGKTVGVQVTTYAAGKIINKVMKDEVVKTSKGGNKSKKKDTA